MSRASKNYIIKLYPGKGWLYTPPYALRVSSVVAPYITRSRHGADTEQTRRNSKESPVLSRPKKGAFKVLKEGERHEIQPV